ncbi:hypothetical protein TraAM80_02446 [Trypanosoma rangeli]|uniref:Uncharacterized protein n=1 Tax=Trypanosoma rangeli TaxID=5698 RepID=A0A3R7KLL9_TRYRA|nr:uncharacterized protein TraAM80_02446 [Trypanosoma rangeli]RNF08901.1 hypothetical protein TraAM80_02446 [Trypanosoma rangeli]|eukprot:RNF08901.1 hypothetical protein TraAM80_02446 [Trypanosoma rangeli]
MASLPARASWRTASKHYSNRTVEETKAEREAQIEKSGHPDLRNRREELSHLTHHCGYEYVPEFQRWTNGMMAVYSDPQGCMVMTWHIITTASGKRKVLHGVVLRTAAELLSYARFIQGRSHVSGS